MAGNDPQDTFFSAMKSAIQMGNRGTPFTGPGARPIAGLAGTVLAFLGHLAQSRLDTGSRFNIDTWPVKCMARAVLAEAALQAVLVMPPDAMRNYGFIQVMQRSFERDKNAVDLIAQRSGPAVSNSAIRLLGQYRESDSEDSAQLSYPELPLLSTEFSVDSDQEGFMYTLEHAAREERRPEGFYDFSSSVTKTALAIGPLILHNVRSVFGGNNADFEPTAGSRNDRTAALQPHVQALFNRALMADAVLEAVLKINARELHEQGVHTSMVDSIAEIGSMVFRISPDVVRSVAANVPKAGSGPTRPTDQLPPTPARPAGPVPKQNTLADLLG